MGLKKTTSARLKIINYKNLFIQYLVFIFFCFNLLFLTSCSSKKKIKASQLPKQVSYFSEDENKIKTSQLPKKVSYFSEDENKIKTSQLPKKVSYFSEDENQTNVNNNIQSQNDEGQDDEGQDDELQKKDESSSKQQAFAINEPTITNTTNSRSIKLTNLLNNNKEAFFNIDDQVIFSTDESTLIKSRFSDVQFTIKSHCVDPVNQVPYHKDFIMPYRDSINFLEIIPEEVLLKGKKWWSSKEFNYPTCSFNFIAQNSQKDIHYFEIPHLPVKSMSRKNRLYILNNTAEEIQKEIEENQIIKVNEIHNYDLKNSTQIRIDRVKLKCEFFESALDVENTNTYHLQEWADFLDQIPEEYQFTQACRFISYHNEQIVSVSQLFPLFYTPNEILVNWELPDQKTLLWENFVQDLKAGDRNEYEGFFKLNIENKSNNRARFFIPKTKFKSSFISFFKINEIEISVIPDKFKLEKAGFFTEKKAGLEVYFSQINQHKSKDGIFSQEGGIIRIKDEKIIVEVKPQSQVRIDFTLGINELCKVRDKSLNQEHVEAILNYDYLPVYHTLDSYSFEMAELTSVDLVPWVQEENIREEDTSILNTISNKIKKFGGFETNQKVNKKIFINTYKETLPYSYFYKADCNNVRSGIVNEKYEYFKDPSWKVESSNEDGIVLKEIPHSLFDRYKDEEEKKSQRNK